MALIFVLTFTKEMSQEMLSFAMVENDISKIY